MSGDKADEKKAEEKKAADGGGGKGKKGEKEEDSDLSEEDQALQAQMELLVTRSVRGDAPPYRRRRRARVGARGRALPALGIPQTGSPSARP